MPDNRAYDTSRGYNISVPDLFKTMSYPMGMAQNNEIKRFLQERPMPRAQCYGQHPPAGNGGRIRQDWGAG
ncbi:hypothetical protein F1542_10425, partial [Komagataeibacter sp. FXV3]|nr:hypothetical protein [Komagataeibacter sp. FXV3]